MNSRFPCGQTKVLTRSLKWSTFIITIMRTVKDFNPAWRRTSDHVRSMFELILSFFRCRHKRFTFPQTDQRTKQTSVACVECGARYLYSWDQMRRTGRVHSPEITHPCPVRIARTTV